MSGEIGQTVYRWAWCYDSGDVAGAAAVFAPDGRLDVPRASYGGRDEIGRFYADSRAARAAAGEQPRHLITNVLVLKETPEEALVHSYLLFGLAGAGSAPSVRVLGWYEDRLPQHPRPRPVQA